MAETSDDILWRRTSRGDQEAFAELFDRHVRRVHGFCLRQTGDWALAQDLTSVTFLEAWRRQSVLVEQGKVVAWLLGIAFNVVRQERRSRRRYRQALQRLPVPPPDFDHADESAARATAEVEATELLAQLRQLPKKEQAVLVLTAWEGLSSAETAVALGVPEATVRSRLHRARVRLQSGGAGCSGPPSVAPAVSANERIGS